MGVAQFHQVSEVWLTQIGCAGWRGGLALSLVLVWSRVMRRTPGRVQCWLWRLAFLNLLTAGLWISPLELRLLPPVDPVSGSTGRIEPVTGTTQVGPLPGDVKSRDVDLADSHFRRVDSVELPARTMARMSLSGWLLIAWCVGMILISFRLLRHWFRPVVRRRSRPIWPSRSVKHSVN